EPTVKRAPYALTDAAFAETTQRDSRAEDGAIATGDDVEDAEDETATDAMGRKRSETHDGVALSDALPTVAEEDEEDTRTQKKVDRAPRAIDGGPIGSLPAATRDL